MDQCRQLGLQQETIEAIENRMLIGYYPFPIWRQLIFKKANMKSARIEFSNRFSGRLPYYIFVAPILFLPRLLALIYGVFLVVLGRTISGDARRGIYFSWNKLLALKSMLKKLYATYFTNMTKPTILNDAYGLAKSTDSVNFSAEKEFGKTILIVNQYYPPDRSATAGILETAVQTLSKSFNVTVLAGRPSYLPLVKYPWKLLFKSKNQNCSVIRVGSTAFPRFSTIRRISNYFSYLFLAFPVSLFIKSDLIIAMTDPPLAGFIAILAARILKKPFIYYLQDLHPDMAIASGMIKNSTIAQIWSKAHEHVLKAADHLIVIGDDMKEKIRAKGIDLGKISVIRHGTPDFNLSITNTSDSALKVIKDKYSFVFIYAGNIGGYGAWEPIVAAIKCVNNHDIGYVFVGEGQKENELKMLSQGLPNVQFYPYQPRERLSSVLLAGDVHIITIKSHLEGLIVPSKIYSILGVGKPILGVCSERSDSARIIKQFQCGLVADPESTDSIVRAILHFYSMKGKLQTFEHNSLLAAEHFNQVSLLKEFSQKISQFLPQN